MPPRTRIVRRAPLSERIWAALNPLDFLLWLSEEIETRDLDSKSTGIQLGLGLNFAFLLLRANARPSNSADDVFSDTTGSGWLAYLVRPTHAARGGFSAALSANLSPFRSSSSSGRACRSPWGTPPTSSRERATTDSSKRTSSRAPVHLRLRESASSLRRLHPRPCACSRI